MVATNARQRFVQSFCSMVREKGYAATTIDGVCDESKASKGGFFHHFSSKSDLCMATIEAWRVQTESFFAAADYNHAEDPLDRVMGYLELRSRLITDEVAEWSCFLGTLLQETYASHPELRAACADAIRRHVREFALNLDAAKLKHCPSAQWDADEVANLVQATLQGAIILAKATGDVQSARDSLAHLRRYIEYLFRYPSLRTQD